MHSKRSHELRRIIGVGRGGLSSAEGKVAEAVMGEEVGVSI